MCKHCPRPPAHAHKPSTRHSPIQELVKSIDALSRDQLRALLVRLGLQNLAVPVVFPGANRWVDAPQFKRRRCCWGS